MGAQLRSAFSGKDINSAIIGLFYVFEFTREEDKRHVVIGVYKDFKWKNGTG